MRTLTLILAVGLGLVACAGETDDDSTGESGADLSASSGATKSFVARGTGYFPDSSAMEGGFVDRKGVKLNTLQDYLSGKVKYVSTAMDSSAFAYGQRLRIKELNAKYGKDIEFRVVDTGGAFRGKGTSRIDICTANSKASTEATINGTLHIDAISANAPSVDPGGSGTLKPTPAPTSTTEPVPSSTTPRPTPTSAPSGGGKSCSSDGACNPGNDGAGLICEGGQCVPGCHRDANCPGVTTCKSGQCR